MTEASPAGEGGDLAVRRGGVRLLLAIGLAAACGRDRGAAAVASDTALPPPPDAGVVADPVAAIAAAPATPAEADSALTPAAVAAFVAHVDTARQADSTTVARGYTSQGLRLLAAGIEALAARDTANAAAARPRLDVLRTRADSLQAATDPLVRARLASEAFVLAGDLLQTLQEGLAQPSLTDRAAEARQAAAAVRPDQPLATQGDLVRRFFERSAAALRGLVGVRTG